MLGARVRSPRAGAVRSSTFDNTVASEEAPVPKRFEGVFSFRNLIIIATCCAYLVASSVLILLNKFLLSNDHFPFPLLLSGSGMFMSNIGASALVHVPRLVPDRQVLSVRAYARRILPLGFCSAATLAFGNVAYLYLDVGLLQMLKSCCPVFVLVVAIAFRLEAPSAPLAGAVLLIAGGTATTAATGITAVSPLGLAVQFTSEFCEALRLCLAQALMTGDGAAARAQHPFEALRLMSGACCVFLAVGVWALEWPAFLEARAWERVVAHPHWYAAAACMGFALNLLAFAVIQLTGSLTQKILGTVKNVALVLFSVAFLGERISFRQLLGYQASLLGFAWYQRLKMRSPAASVRTRAPFTRSGMEAVRARDASLVTPKGGLHLGGGTAAQRRVSGV